MKLYAVKEAEIGTQLSLGARERSSQNIEENNGRDKQVEEINLSEISSDSTETDSSLYTVYSENINHTM